MKRKCLLVMVLLFAGLAWRPAPAARAQDTGPVVHAVLFYSPTCPHCEYVITETLPPLLEQYGQQLQILGFDVTHPQGKAMFYSTIDRYGIQSAAVPLLVIDNITLIGSVDIPAQFPDLVESYLKLGGVNWPDIPGLSELLTSAAATATAQPSPELADPQAARPPTLDAVEPVLPEAGWQVRFAMDRTGNTVAVVVLVGMLAALIWGARLFRSGERIVPQTGIAAWIIPAAALVGLVVAAYLAYIEVTDTRAFCGPIGDCNTVQQSPYARLFGVLSIGVVGLIGYAAMMIAWAMARFGGKAAAVVATKLLFLMALAGTLFSVYLTFLEPFVIGATCAWCLTSAILTTVLMLLSAGPAGRAFTGTAPVVAARRRRARTQTPK